MAKADPKKKDKQDIGGLGLIAGGTGVKSFGANYIPSGTSHVGWKDVKKGFHTKHWGPIESQRWKLKSGQTFEWKRGIGEYKGQFQSQLMTENKRRGWSKGGKTHKNITTRTYKQWTKSYPTSFTAYKGTPDQIKYKWADGSRIGPTNFEHNQFKATQRKTTWRTSIKGGEAAKAQTGLGRDRFGLSIKETKQYGKGIRYKGNRGIVIDVLGSKNRKVLKPAGKFLFPKNEYAVHYLDKAGNVKGLIKRGSKLGTKLSKLTTPQITAGAKLVGKGALKLASGANVVGAAWMAYDAMKWAQQWHKDNPDYKNKKYNKYGTGGY